MKKSLWKNSVWIIFLIVMALLIPSTISMPAQTETRSVSVALGFDKTEDNEIELSTKIIVPQFNTTYNQNSQVISATGTSVLDALSNMSIHLGKVIGLSHCSAIIISKDFENDNIAVLLDEISRSKRVNYNALLIYTNGKSKDILDKATSISRDFTQNIFDIVEYNQNSINAKILYLSDFYRTYYDNHGASLMPILNISKTDTDGLSSITQLQGGGGEDGASQTQSQSGQNQKEYLSNNGETAVIKNGKYLSKLSTDEVRGFGFMTNESNKGVIKLTDITDDKLNHADMIFSLRNRTLNSWTTFSRQGIPQIHYKIICDVKLEQIVDELDKKSMVNETQNFISPVVYSKFSDTVKSICAKAIEKSKQDNFDALDIYTKFDRFNHNEWQQYLAKLENADNYIQNVEFYMEVVMRNVD
ncbi:MAG: hypothetical protein KBT30_00310 [Clostridiales bacterium]|nr:hypothetical protein [Candidatus Apopatousia equi]